MIYSRLSFAGFCLTLCSVLPAYAASSALNVKTGLWEMTMTGETTGAPPIPAEALAQLPPERQARVKAAMAAAMARSAKPHVMRQCLTEAKLREGFDVERDRAGQSCRTTMLQNTGSVMEIRQECSGREKTSGHFRFEAASPIEVNGTIDMTMSDGAHSMHMKRRIHGKWLAAQCGKVK